MNLRTGGPGGFQSVKLQRPESDHRVQSLPVRGDKAASLLLTDKLTLARSLTGLHP